MFFSGESESTVYVQEDILVIKIFVAFPTLNVYLAYVP